MQRFYAEIIDECIEKFRLEDGLTFNFSLLDFRGEVFHNYGLKPPLPEHDLLRLLTHAQKYLNEEGRQNPAFPKLIDALADDISRSDEAARAVYEVVFENRPASTLPPVTSKHIARLVSFLPTKHYWDNSGLIYRRACQDEANFSKIYLSHYLYDEQHRRAEEVLCREIGIPAAAIDSYHLKEKFAELHNQPFRRNDEFFGLEPRDRELYELYGRLYDLLNWGASNPSSVISYLDAHSQQFEFYNCVFPIVFHGIYYGVAYFDLPGDYFHRTRNVAEKLSRILAKGLTFVNHYFPAMIFDAYNSRLINRFTREQAESAHEVVRLVNSKVPFHFCYDFETGRVFSFELPPGEISKHMLENRWPAKLDYASPDFVERFAQLDSQTHPGQLRALRQQIFTHDLVFVFDLNLLPGREKCLPILESHLGQAAIVLQTLKDQGERKVFKERMHMLDMLAHDAKITRELLIADMLDGLEPDIAAQQLIEQSRKEKVMRNLLLRRPGGMREGAPEQAIRQINLTDLFVSLFCKIWRAWLKSRRFGESFRRNRHPAFLLSAESPRYEVLDFLQAHLKAWPGQPERACLDVLRNSFIALSENAEISIAAPPLLMSEQAIHRIEAILYNLLSNLFNHISPSRLTGCNECVIRLAAARQDKGVYFNFSMSNSTDTKERFAEDIKAMLRSQEVRGLQILRHLMRVHERESPAEFRVRQENYMWHIHLGRECRDCSENMLVDTGAGG